MIKRVVIFFLIAALPLSLSYGADDSMKLWKQYIFDGKEFQEGAASSGPSVYQREGFLPVVRKAHEVLPEDMLPSGTGGLVIFCYLQRSGGKLRNQSGHMPFAGTAVEIRRGTRTIVMRTDGAGYAILALPADEYEIQVRRFTRKARIEKGKTAFVAVRAGKMMVD